MIRYLSLAEYFWLAEQVTGVEGAVLTKASRVDLADSALILFLDLNDWLWEPDPPDTDAAESAMLAVAAREVDEAWLADWIRQRTTQTA